MCPTYPYSIFGPVLETICPYFDRWSFRWNGLDTALFALNGGSIHGLGKSLAFYVLSDSLLRIVMVYSEVLFCWVGIHLIIRQIIYFAIQSPCAHLFHGISAHSISFPAGVAPIVCSSVHAWCASSHYTLVLSVCTFGIQCPSPRIGLVHICLRFRITKHWIMILCMTNLFSICRLASFYRYPLGALHIPQVEFCNHLPVWVGCTSRISWHEGSSVKRWVDISGRFGGTCGASVRCG